MKVRPKENLVKKENLSMNKEYVVYSVETSKNGEKFYRVQNDKNQVVPYSISLFDIVSEKVNSDWIMWQKPNNNSALLPKQFAYLSFWEDFYNDDLEALKIFNLVKEQLIEEEFDEEEINEIFELEIEDEITSVLSVLSKTKDNRFINPVIQYVKTKLEKNYEIDNTTVLAFQYLSFFKESDVENLFLYYLTNIELGDDQLTAVVNEYFSKK
ncbi:hypothetical protein HUB98_12130 [Paenibacillus barcinonensis]|uniref:Uncharacterized protein n=2 Tax=Paenibacillus TaxID=44249 RepID=A0A2V4V830_PAEBA|nr:MULTISPECIES: hypothetical protein [Paenibacillus]PYE42111.1 hypothetical protein DFQ00_1434 [Paenibacillus barcinonensis]PZT51912.1 hypothetical protein DN757_30200 [Paenibacillus silvae]QKS57002.1 hypothetical protein HUB98_12130 [Paenibacillus barcinonensis]